MIGIYYVLNFEDLSSFIFRVTSFLGLSNS